MDSEGRIFQNIIDSPAHSVEIEEEMTFKEVIGKIKSVIFYLLSKWKIIIIVVFLGGCLGFFWANSKQPTYTATTTFVLEDGDKTGGLSQYAGLASMVGVDVNSGGGGIFQGDNLLEL